MNSEHAIQLLLDIFIKRIVVLITGIIDFSRLIVGNLKKENLNQSFGHLVLTKLTNFLSIDMFFDLVIPNM